MLLVVILFAIKLLAQVNILNFSSNFTVSLTLYFSHTQAYLIIIQP